MKKKLVGEKYPYAMHYIIKEIQFTNMRKNRI